jgi:hypothetical protein
MSVYLNKACCKKILERSVATAVKKLNLISEIEDKNSKKYKKLVEELEIINDIIKAINAYVDLKQST